MTKEDMFTLLKNKQYSKVVIEYSGGNDEGGVDSIIVYDHTEKEVEHDFRNIWISRDNMIGWGKDARPATSEEIQMNKYMNVLTKPIYNRFYSFAGEFNVSGELVWDVKNKKVTLSGNESTRIYEPFTVDVK